jgi:hypothetical protein
MPYFLFCQQRIEIYGAYNQPLHHSFTNFIRNHQLKGRQVKQINYTIGSSVQLYRNERFIIRSGLSYKFIQLNALDFIDSIQYRVYIPSGQNYFLQKEKHFYTKDKPDLINKSHSLAINLDLRYRIPQINDRYSQEVGILTNLYVFEFFNAYYVSKEIDDMRRKGNSPSVYWNDEYIFDMSIEIKTPRNFFLSAVDLNLFYQFNWIISPDFSLGLRASIGTNLYSDWNQFKKYLWAGFSLHVGFLKDEKVRLNKKE